MFTLDTESGFDQVVFITASYGLGETVVQGAVNPDEFYVYKPNLDARAAGDPAQDRRRQGDADGVRRRRSRPGSRPPPSTVADDDRHRFSITDAEAHELARYAVAIEKHYGRPMDIEWGRDGVDGKLYILQARPETVKSRESAGNLRRYRLKSTSDGAGERPRDRPEDRAGRGAPRSSRPRRWTACKAGDVLVADMTDPDWEPVMKRAAAIVTNRGGRTCHAAIIARELGIPAVVGCGDATQRAGGRRAGDGVVRRGRHRARLRRDARRRGRRRRARPDAAVADQDHDERRQSRARVRVPPAAERGRGPRAARVHHQQERRHPSEGAARARPPAARAAARDPRAHRRLREPDRVLRRARSPRAWRRSPRRSGRRR